MQSKAFIPIIFMMLGFLVIALGIMYAVTPSFGSDWTWISNETIMVMPYIIVLALSLFVLVGWLRRR